MNTAGGGIGKRTLTKEGPHPLDEFRRTIELNLIATFNLNRLQAHAMSTNEPEDGERGVMINTASIAAFEGQIGQVAYTAAKAGIAGMTLTMARDLGSLGIRVLSIAPSLFSTGITEGIPDEFADVLTKDAAFPKRMGRPEEYGKLAVAIVENPMLNGSLHPPRRRPALRAEVGLGLGADRDADRRRRDPRRRRRGTRSMPITSSAIRETVPVELRADACEEQRHREQHHAEHVVRRSLDVAAHLCRQHLGLGIELLGLLLGLELVLGHGERRWWRVRP